MVLTWDLGLAAIDYATCDGDDGAVTDLGPSCDDERGQVLEISASPTILTPEPAHAVKCRRAIEFDIQIISGDSDISVKIDCVYPCTSGASILAPSQTMAGKPYR